MHYEAKNGHLWGILHFNFTTCLCLRYLIIKDPSTGILATAKFPFHHNFRIALKNKTFLL